MSKERVEVPENYNYAEAYLTFRCNLKCSYCINDVDGIERKREELTGEQWIDGLRRLDLRGMPLTFGGGEPTLHKDFFEIVNGMKKDQKLDLLTNLNFDLDDFIVNVDAGRFMPYTTNPVYRSIRASFHPGQHDARQQAARAAKLQDAGFSVGIFGISHPDNTVANMEMAEFARREGVYFYTKEFLGKHAGELYGTYKYPEALDGEDKSVLCKPGELLMSPAGSIHRCHRDLYLNQYPLGNITDDELHLRETYELCNKCGECNPCDVKKKTGKDLKLNNCSVDILGSKGGVIGD